MPIMIEDMQAEVLPERVEPEDTTAVSNQGTPNETQLLDSVVREQQIRDERRRRWWAD